MKPTRKATVVDEPVHRAPGAFMPDGSWNENSELHHRGQLHRLVVALCRHRRHPNLTPERAAHAIVAANATLAFPNHAQWSSCVLWGLVYCSTSAEEAVKREGRGVSGHWCGEHWAQGPESACGEPSHRTYPSHEEVSTMLARIRASLPGLGPDPVRNDPPARVEISDEQWFAERGTRAHNPAPTPPPDNRA